MISLHLPQDFLVQIAHEKGLSPEQIKVLILRFSEQREYSEIAEQLNTSAGACLKRMGQVYKKFGIEGGARGKEGKLQNYLLKTLQQSKTLNQSVSRGQPEAASGKTQITAPAVSVSSSGQVSELEYPGTPVGWSSTFYIERPPSEELCYQETDRPGALIRIKAPQKVGKTSLLFRILKQAEEKGYQTTYLNLDLVDNELLSDLDKFLRWFCTTLTRKLKLHNKLDDYWDPEFGGSKINCESYFEDYLLEEIDRPLVLGLDDVDRIFDDEQAHRHEQSKSVVQEFFSLLRAFHENSKHSKTWGKLRLVIAYSTEAYIPLDINQSPFNVGLPVELPEFSAQQVEKLAFLHDLDWSNEQLKQLMRLVGGHPYLIRLALYHLNKNKITLEELLSNAAKEFGIFGDYLRGILLELEDYPELLEALKAVISSEVPIRLDSKQGFKLNSLGLVKLSGNRVALSCDLYHQFFQRKLMSSPP